MSGVGWRRTPLIRGAAGTACSFSWLNAEWCGGGNGDGGDGGGAVLPSEEKPSFGSGGLGDGGEKNALTFRSAKSRWKNSGRSNKGTSNLKFSRSSGFGGFGVGAASF